MTERIGDLISVDQQAALVRGVQLNWYWDPTQEKENERLATNYIFSSGITSPNRHSAISIFEKIRDCLTGKPGPNVFTVIADYGHGKSHFALVMANYFGRTNRDRVLERILTKIQECSNKGTAERFRSFKQSCKKPQLVVQLSGQDFIDLRQGFLQALRRALDKCEETRDYPIRAISVEAAAWLRSLKSRERQKAEEYLEDHHQLEIEALIHALESFDSSKAWIARDVSRTLYPKPLDFAADVNLREIINQVIDDLCTGERAPFHKMIILFDELGIYCEKWCYNRMAAGDLAPQQIIEACDDRRGKVCLVALSQRELGGFVTRYPGQDEFKKWAERFPIETSLHLESSLEHVIKGVITKQKPWKSFMQELMPSIERTSEAAWGLLPMYQRKSQAWPQNKFLSTVGVGCFPLHPLTTGLLCNLPFAQGGRTIIAFVNEAVQEIREQPALKSGELNWILPTILVDKFEDNFEGQEVRYSIYENAKRKLGANVPSDLYLVLKALFLYDVGELDLGSQSHARVLSNLCGLSEGKVRTALNLLSQEYYVIRYVKAKREYEFSGIGTSVGDIREQLRREIVGRTLPSLAAKLEASKMLEKAQSELPSSEANDFKRGHAIQGEEWQLTPRLVDANRLNADWVSRTWEEMERAGTARGLIVYTVSHNGAQLDEVKEHAEGILENLKRESYPYPIVIAVPESAAGDLYIEVLMREVLDSWGHAQRERYGDGYEMAVEDSTLKIVDELKAHLKEARYYVAPTVRQRLLHGEIYSLSRIADRLFEMAYPFRVPASPHVMKLTSSKGNSIVAEVGCHLLEDDLHRSYSKLKKEVQNLIDTGLVYGRNLWGILGAKHKIQEPGEPRVKHAWDRITEAAKSGQTVYFRLLSRQLKNLPFGHDDFTLTLLYTAWIGHHRKGLNFIGAPNPKKDKTAKPIKIEDLKDKLQKAKNFIKWLHEGNVQMTWTDLGQERERVFRLIAQTERVTDYEQARRLQGRLEEARGLFNADAEILHAIRAARTRLQEMVKQVDDYLHSISKLESAAKETEGVIQLLRLEQELIEIPAPNCLKYSDKPFTELKQGLHDRVELHVKRVLNQPLSQLEDYTALKLKFESIRDALDRAGRENLKQECGQALERIKQQHEELTKQQSEEGNVRKIEALRVDGTTGLSTCREYLDHIDKGLMSLLANATEQSRWRVKKKRQAIADKVEEYERWISGLPQQVGLIKEPQNARKLHDEILKRKLLYDSTPELEILEQWLGNLEGREQELRLAHRLTQLEQKAITRQGCDDALSQIEELMTEFPNTTETILDARNRIRAKLDDLSVQERKRANQWLEQLQRAFNDGLPSQEAHKLLRDLEHPPEGLIDEDQPFLESIREKLNQICDKDLVGKIVGDFDKLQTKQQRGECLLEIAKRCRAEGLSPGFTKRLLEILEMQTSI